MLSGIWEAAPFYLVPPHGYVPGKRGYGRGTWLGFDAPTVETAKRWVMALRRQEREATKPCAWVSAEPLFVAGYYPRGVVRVAGTAGDAEALVWVPGSQWSIMFRWPPGDDVAEPNIIAHMDAEPVHSEPCAQLDFTAEFEGTRPIPARDETTADVRHGRIVRALVEFLTKRGMRVANDRERDLVATAEGRRWLFEVKTDTDTQSVYTGVGQLMVNGRASDPTAEHFLVLPEQPRDSAALHALSIVVVLFDWNDDGAPTFEGIPR